MAQGDGTCAGEVIAVDQIGRPRGRTRGTHERIQVELFQHGVDSLLARELMAALMCRVVVSLRERIAFGEIEQLLQEETHLFVCMSVVEIDGLGQRFNRQAAACGKVLVQIALELIDQHDEFRGIR